MRALLFFGADDSLVFVVALEFCVLIDRGESLVGERETISLHGGTEQQRARHREPLHQTPVKLLHFYIKYRILT